MVFSACCLDFTNLRSKKLITSRGCKKQMKKKILVVLGVLFLAFFLWRIASLIFANKQISSQRPGRPPVAVQIDSVRHSAIIDTREYTGTVHALYQYIVAPKVSGRIVRMNKRIGDWVKRGEILVRIDDAEYQQATAEAEANLKIARASLAEAASQITLAKQELERVQSLQEKGIASPAELDAALTNHQAQQSRLELATAQVEQREAALASAKIRLSYTVLAASQPGYIGERYIDEGSLLAPNTPVFMVIGIDSVIVRTTIVERDYGSIKIGQPCQVRVDAFSDKPFTGRVSHIAPMLQQESRMAQMELIVANSDHLLKPGMFARVQVRIAEKEQAQVVPSAALVRRNGQQGVFVLEQDKPEVRYMPVTVGIFNNEWAEITSPAIQGQVVTLGQHLLEDGSQVILPKTVGENSAVPRSQVKE